MFTVEKRVPRECRPARVSSENEIAAEALTVNEFMRAYKLGRSSVYKLIRTKKLQSKKILGKRLILVSSAKALLEPNVPVDA
jgi:predicted DNA-binding transcriptional regulator AlpA